VNVVGKKGNGRIETFEVVIDSEKLTHIWTQQSRRKRTIVFVMLWALAGASTSKAQLLIASFNWKRKKNAKRCTRRNKRKKKKLNAKQKKRSRRNKGEERRKQKSSQEERKEEGGPNDEVDLIQAVVVEVEVTVATAVHHIVHTRHGAMEVFPPGRLIVAGLTPLIQATAAVRRLPIVAAAVEVVAIEEAHHIQVTVAVPIVEVADLRKSLSQKENAAVLLRFHGLSHQMIEKSAENTMSHLEKLKGNRRMNMLKRNLSVMNLHLQLLNARTIY